MNDRRRRIKARLTYRHWSIMRQLRWLPPYGWITRERAMFYERLKQAMETPPVFDIGIFPVDPKRYRK